MQGAQVPSLVAKLRSHKLGGAAKKVSCHPFPKQNWYFLFFFFMWTTFKVFIEFVIILFLFYVLFFWPWNIWDLSSQTRAQTSTPSIGRWNLDQWTTWEVQEMVGSQDPQVICMDIKFKKYCFRYFYTISSYSIFKKIDLWEYWQLILNIFPLKRNFENPQILMSSVFPHSEGILFPTLSPLILSFLVIHFTHHSRKWFCEKRGCKTVPQGPQGPSVKPSVTPLMRQLTPYCQREVLLYPQGWLSHTENIIQRLIWFVEIKFDLN